MPTELSAEVLGRAAERDLQIDVPTWPVMRRGVRLRRAGDSVVLDGSDRPQRYTGAFAREHLVRLGASCDGRHDQQMIADDTGIPLPGVRRALALLWATGAIEQFDEAQPAIRPQLATLLSRLANSTGAHRSWQQGAQTLATTRVGLTGPDDVCERAAAGLDGLFKIAALGACAEEDVDLVIWFDTGNPKPPREVDACWASGKPLLRVRVCRSDVRIGPYIDPAFTPCLACSLHDEPAGDGASDGPSLELAIGLAGHHLAALLSRAMTTHLPLDTGITDTTTLKTTYRAAASLGGCARCSATQGPMASNAPVGVKFEASVALPPRRFLDPRGHLAHYQASNIRLQAQFRSWPSCPALALPSAPISRLGDPLTSATPVLDQELLGLFLAVGFGLHDQPDDSSRVKRWTASGGNLGTASAYLVAGDDSIIPGGVYAYTEQDHSLLRLRGGSGMLDTPLSLVITGNLTKVMQKYGTFGLRLCMLDAGCAMASIREVSDRIGIPVNFESDWPEALIHQTLGTDDSTEPIIAVVSLGGEIR